MLQSIREADVYAGQSFDLRAKPGVEEGKSSTDFRAMITAWERSCEADIAMIAIRIGILAPKWGY